MTKLEQDLKTVFRDETADVPAEHMHDPVNAVVRRAAGLRRRRWALAAGATALAVLMGTGAVATIANRPEPAQFASERARALQPAGPPNGLGVDLKIGNVLSTAEGARWELPSAEWLETAWWHGRVREGWIVSGAPGLHGGVSLMGHDGRFRVIVRGAMQVVISPDGRRLAWSGNDSRTVFVGRLAGGSVVDVRSVRMKQRALVWSWAGDWVVVSDHPWAKDDKDAGYAVLDPDTGQVDDELSRRRVVNFLGASPDGQSILARVRRSSAGNSYCLASLDPERNLAVITQNCELGLWPWEGGSTDESLSPDGRWLFDTHKDTWALIDVRAALAGESAVTEHASQGEVGHSVWADNQTAVALSSDHNGLRMLHRWTVGGKPVKVPVAGDLFYNEVQVVDRYDR